ncbi:MAG: helix-turn-helix domain-containing protein [Prevotellaceae bacterium]|jgi:excisionase family DNA binding protein|nr:helix-turn-helix domain-containing protein [Prevotellaceae bacterium]
MNTKYLKMDDVCKILDIAKSTLYSYVGKGKIPYLKIGGKLKFDENDIANWLDSKKHIEIAVRENV